MLQVPLNVPAACETYGSKGESSSIPAPSHCPGPAAYECREGGHPGGSMLEQYASWGRANERTKSYRSLNLNLHFLKGDCSPRAGLVLVLASRVITFLSLMALRSIGPSPSCRPARREVTYILGLLLLAVAFGMKRWRYLRSRRADQEYEKRRWGQARVVAEVQSSRHSYFSVHARRCCRVEAQAELRILAVTGRDAARSRWARLQSPTHYWSMHTG